jgi:hypothetical protein
MIVRNRQDYEQLNMRKYIFNIQIDGKQISVQITINNIFDNIPVITSGSNPCQVQELQEPILQTGCLFVRFFS